MNFFFFSSAALFFLHFFWICFLNQRAILSHITTELHSTSGFFSFQRIVTLQKKGWTWYCQSSTHVAAETIIRRNKNKRDNDLPNNISFGELPTWYVRDCHWMFDPFIFLCIFKHSHSSSKFCVPWTFATKRRKVIDNDNRQLPAGYGGIRIE